MIPFLGIARQYDNLREEILNATDAVYSSGKVLDGYFTHEFEDQIAKRCDRKFAVAVNSGTQALIFAQQCQGILQNKVLIPGISFVATLNSVVMAGNEPVIVDTDNDFLMDLYKASQFMEQGNISAVMFVNLYGNVIDYNNLKTAVDLFFKDQEIKIIEDAAQSFGATYDGIPSGKLGDVSVLSFDPTKNLNNYGSGGMLLTDDPMLYNDLRDIRDNGKYLGFASSGTNSKMSESDCAQMLVKLQYFDQWQKRRADIANFYTEHLHQFVTPVLPKSNVKHAWHKYVVTTNRDQHRGELYTYLKERGIETKVHYENTLADYTAAGVSNSKWSHAGFNYSYLPTASRLVDSCLSLPIYPELTDAEVEYIAESVIGFYVDL